MNLYMINIQQKARNKMKINKKLSAYDLSERKSPKKPNLTKVRLIRPKSLYDLSYTEEK